MTKNIVKLVVLPALVVLIGYSSYSVEDTVDTSSYSTKGLDLLYTVSPDIDNKVEAPSLIALAKTGKTFMGFKEALGFKESQNDYERINHYGYMGKYQFGQGTLLSLGITDTDAFVKNPVLQEKAFNANAARNKWILRKDIKRFVGKTINGVEITESGILAAAHLAGAGGVKNYLRSLGDDGFEDAFGTSIKSYLKKFGGYDVSFIQSKRNAKV